MKEFFGDSIERFISTHPFFGRNRSTFGKEGGRVYTPIEVDENQINDFLESMGQYERIKRDRMYNILILLHYVFIILAVYMAMSCKNKTGNTSFFQIILAICFAPFYIVYRIAKPCF